MSKPEVMEVMEVMEVRALELLTEALVRLEATAAPEESVDLEDLLATMWELSDPHRILQ